MNLVTQSGDVLIGWTKEENYPDPDPLEQRICSSFFELLPEIDWVINPSNKTEKRSWSDETDLLLVISWKDNVENSESEPEY
jgi:hypothetical protein